MANISQIVKKFVKEYQVESGRFFRVVVPDGRGGQIRKQGFLSEKDALHFATDCYKQCLFSKDLKVNSQTVRFPDFANRWIEMKKAEKVSVATFMRYNDELRFRIVPYFEGFKVSEIEKKHLRLFIEHLQSSDESTATIEYAVTVFKQVMKYAEEIDVIGPRGFSSVKMPKHRVKAPVFWDSSQINYFVNATKDNKWNSLWALALYTGMRAGEISALKWSAVELDSKIGSHQGFIKIERMYNQKTKSVQETTKNGENRIVPLLPEAREILQELLKTKNGDYVLGGSKALTTGHFSRDLKSELKKHPQLPEITFHGLRHSFCSYLESSGISRRIVAEVMGHLDINTTSRYSHVNSNMLGEAFFNHATQLSKQKTNNLHVVNY